MHRIITVLFTIASALFCYLSCYEVSDSLQADAIYPLSFALELNEGIQNLRDWNYSAVTFWFPDVAATILIAKFLSQQYILLVNVILGIIQVVIFQYCNIKIIKNIIKAENEQIISLLTAISSILFFTLSDQKLLGPITLPVHHFSAFILSLAILILYFKIFNSNQLTRLNKVIILLIIASVAPTTLSDPFFLLFGGLPLIITVTVPEA